MSLSEDPSVLGKAWKPAMSDSRRWISLGTDLSYQDICRDTEYSVQLHT
jgi:hypothetical protein